MWVELTVAVVCLGASLYMYCRHVYSRFARLGIKYVEPVPFLGNFAASTFTNKKNIFNVLQDLYDAFPEEKYIGVFESFDPIIMLREPELIRQITVKDFDHFVDHRAFINDDADPLFGKCIFVLKGQKWRDMRYTLSPAFTSAKMRGICPFTVECAQQIVQYLEEECAKIDGDRLLDVDARDICTRYTNDVIASVTFGLRINSVRDRENQFYMTGLSITSFSNVALFKQYIATTAPRLARLLKLKIFNDKMTNFFRNLVRDTMRYREEKNIHRADMINILMEAKKGTLKHENNVSNDDVGFATVEESSVGKQTTQRNWTDDDLMAQAFLFFFTGFDINATLMSFLTVELAVNPDVQSKLAAEIDEAYEEGAELNYERIQKLKYLDMVICEILRKWPPAPLVDRLCNKSYVLEPAHEGGQSIKINKGDLVFLPIGAIQRDPKYWPEPEKFDPERFSDENRSRVQPFTYLPFGSGPRNCIASRFALLEVKILVYHLVRHFEILLGPKTHTPIMLDSACTVQQRVKGGSWLRLKSRKKMV